MTGGIYELSDEAWAVVDPSADLIIQGSDIEAAGLAELVSGCVLVYSTDDDYSWTGAAGESRHTRYFPRPPAMPDAATVMSRA